MLGRTDSRGRLLLVLAGFVILGTTLVGRLAFWQVVQRDHLADLAAQQTTVQVEEPSHRGTIYDRTGTVVLATTVDRSRLVAAPIQLSPERRAEVAQRLVTLLALKGTAATKLTASIASTRGYVILAHGLDAAMAEQIRSALASGDLAGLSLESEPVRVYPQEGGSPNTTLAAQALGFVNSAGVGQYGVEQYYQNALAGQPTVLVASRAATGEVVAGDGEVLTPGTPGVDIALTLDAGLQLALEQELLAAWVADRAVSVSAVVMDPYTGAVYAEGSYPSYNANDYQAIASKDPSRFVDPTISSVYEPGSVFKMVTASAALRKGVVKPTTLVNDTGVMQLDGGQTHISDADHVNKGFMTFQDIVAYSRNVGAAKVAFKLGKTTKSASGALYSEWQKLGFGKPTGIDLAGEVAGIVKNPAQTAWRQIDLANGSFGQGVAVTPMQLAAAYSAMVNGGVLPQPHIVQSVGGQDRIVTQRGQVISKKNVPTLTRMLNHVVTEVDFYRDRTLVPGYYVGGKTGTAQIWDPRLRGGRGDWKNNVFNYSFVGFIGKTAPRLIIAVQVHEGTPTVLEQGHIEMPVMSFELFRRIATDAITTLDLPRPDGTKSGSGGSAVGGDQQAPSPDPSARPTTPKRTPVPTASATPALTPPASPHAVDAAMANSTVGGPPTKVSGLRLPQPSATATGASP